MSNEFSFNNYMSRVKFWAIISSVFIIVEIIQVLWNVRFLWWVSRLLLSLFLLAPAISSSRNTGIKEFLVIAFTLPFLFLELPKMVYNADLFSWLDDLVKFMFVALTLPWLWLSYQYLQKQVLRLSLIISTILVFILSIIEIITKSDPSHILAYYLVSFWMIISVIMIEGIFPSQKLKLGKMVLVGAFLILAIVSYYHGNVSGTISNGIVQFGVTIYSLLIWNIIFTNSEMLIITKSQTLTAAKKYFARKSILEETSEDCIVFINFDSYIRSIPESVLFDIDNEDLTNLWINVQK
ncbi:MAG: hypothetical protein INQ03_25630 [Candidatus Heimdallarchaeota archaeon]|nr:hypothetical protein [Candidatus Heimdallarchaeota archaeon]